MTGLLPTLLLMLCLLAGLLLVPLEQPGLWVMVLTVLGYGWLTAFQAVGMGIVACVVGLALIGEVIEWWLAFRFGDRCPQMNRTIQFREACGPCSRRS